MAAPVLLTHPSSLEHDPGPHPECAERMVAIETELAARGGLGWERRESVAATDEQLLLVHPRAHLDFVRGLCEAGGGFIDADTSVSRGSWEAALHGAGGACGAVDLALGGAAAFSAHRPPGHHCTADRPMGFCLLSSAAIAARWAIAAHGLSRVLVLDWDVHHGNGTHDVLLGDADALFVSIHQSPLYPGTGPAGQTGVGAGEGFTVNLPVPGGSGDAEWVSLVAHVAGSLVEAWSPELVIVSAGFDAHEDDPLAGCSVTDAGFAAMAACVGSWGVPVAVVLEGGYDLAALGRGVCETMGALGGADAAQVELSPLADAALARLRGGAWPELR